MNRCVSTRSTIWYKIFHNSSMESTSIVGYAWRYLEIQGKLNAAARKSAPRQTFYIESDEDDDSLLRFTKEIVPHKELIPPPQFANQKQLLRSQNPRLNSDSLAMTAMRSSRQGADTEMTSNAFSNLDAIAKMGIDEHDTFSGQNTPVAGGGNLSVEQGLISSNSCGQLAQGFEQQRVGGIGRLQMPMHRIGMPATQQQQQMLHQMSPVEQQQRLNILYKQQQQKAQIPSATYRLMGTPQTGAEVFDFDEPPNFGSTIGSPSYNSPIGGGRRRGRGRRAGNMGDRQLSISSLESTPSSPSDYNPTGSGKRRAGIPGQRKPRKLKKQEEASNSFDQQQLPPFQQQFQQNMLTQQQSMISDDFAAYNPVQTQEEVRSRLVSAYEIKNYESPSSDEEMDPPPPPRNLELKSAENEKKMEIQSGKAPAQKSSITQHKLSTTSMQKLLQEQLQQTSEMMLDVKQEIPQSNAPQSQQPIILKDIKLPYTASSSSSSPSTISTPQQQQNAQQSNLGDAIESRKNSKTKIDEIAKELEQLKQQPPTMDEKTNTKQKKNAPTLFDDLFDNGIENTAIKEIFEPTKPKEANCITKSKNSADKEQSVKQKKQSAEESTKKPGKIVLKIPREGTAQMATKNSSSSSPSSTSSSISASNFAQILSQMGDQPVARLSSSAAPPSKLKQQTAAQQKRPPKRPLDALEEGMKQKKSRKNEDSGKNSPTPRSTPSSTGQLKASKSSKSKNNGQSTKEPAPAPSSHMAIPPFPSLKNFKIPKVSEATETTTTQSSSATSSTMNRPGPSEHSSRSAEKEGRKSSTSSYSNVSPSNSSDYRRHGEKTNNSSHFKGIWEKGTSGSTASSSSHSSNYNRQQQRSSKPDKRDRDQQDNSRSSKKYANHSNDRSGGRPPTSSRPPSYQQPPPHSPRESGGIHQAFSSQNWPQFNQQYMPVYQQQIGGQQQQQKSNWMPQRLQSSQQMTGGFEQTQQQIYQQQYRQMPADEYHQTLQQQQRPNSNHEEKTKSVEDRNDNSPSGDGLQIVDEE